MLVFGFLVAAGFYARRRSEVHKRLMLLATISLLDAAVGRLPFTALVRAGLFNAFLLASPLYDLIFRRRVYLTYVGGLLLIFAAERLAIAVARTDSWRHITDWLLR